MILRVLHVRMVEGSFQCKLVRVDPLRVYLSVNCAQGAVIGLNVSMSLPCCYATDGHITY